MKMKQKLRSRLLAICTALICGCVMLLSGGVVDIESYAATDTGEVSVIFTHDMHSHMDADRVSKDGKVVEAGGFGKLKTAMDEVRSDYPDSFVLDGGDFSMGTPYQTIFSKEACQRCRGEKRYQRIDEADGKAGSYRAAVLM